MKKFINHLKNMNATRAMSYLLFTGAVLILVGVIYFAMNIDVIKDWTLTLPTGDIRSGDTVVVASRYTKLRSVKGTSVRSIECESTPGIFVSQPLNKVPANRAPGNTGTGIVVQMPTKLAGEITFPVACRICVALEYPVLPLKKVPYFKCTKTFALLPKDSESTSQTPQTNQVQAVAQSPASNSSVTNSYSNSTPSTSKKQSDILQPTPVDPEQPSLLEQITTPVTNLLKGVL